MGIIQIHLLLLNSISIGMEVWKDYYRPPYVLMIFRLPGAMIVFLHETIRVMNASHSNGPRTGMMTLRASGAPVDSPRVIDL